MHQLTGRSGSTTVTTTLKSVIGCDLRCDIHGKEGDMSMTIKRIQSSNAGAVAALTSTLKPEWWDSEGANQQLQDVQLLATLVG